MTLEQYERRANDISVWAKAQYDAGKLSEDAIERAVERMFDKLDDEYMASDKYPGWTSTQSATRDNW